MVHCPAAVCTIYPVWQLPSFYPVIGEACTQVFHLYDHYHYVRWVSVHLRDMMTLSHLHPHMLAGFLEGHFTVKKTSHVFSNMAT